MTWIIYLGCKSLVISSDSLFYGGALGSDHFVIGGWGTCFFFNYYLINGSRGELKK